MCHIVARKVAEIDRGEDTCIFTFAADRKNKKNQMGLLTKFF